MIPEARERISKMVARQIERVSDLSMVEIEALLNEAFGVEEARIVTYRDQAISVAIEAIGREGSFDPVSCFEIAVAVIDALRRESMIELSDRE